MRWGERGRSSNLDRHTDRQQMNKCKNTNRKPILMFRKNWFVKTKDWKNEKKGKKVETARGGEDRRMGARQRYVRV